MSEVDVLTARLDVEGLAGFTRSMAQADASVDALRKNLRGLTDDALEARAALGRVGADLGPAIAQFAALNDEVKRTRDTLLEASAAGGDIGASDASRSCGPLPTTPRRSSEETISSRR